MRNIPSYEAFVGESYEAIRKAMRDRKSVV